MRTPEEQKKREEAFRASLIAALEDEGIGTFGAILLSASTNFGRPTIVVSALVENNHQALRVFVAVATQFPGEPQFVPEFEEPDDVGGVLH
jgi:hypothetical protein